MKSPSRSTKPEGHPPAKAYPGPTTWTGIIDPRTVHAIPFRKIDEPYGWLGNMSRHPLRVPREPGGVFYPTAEHFFQCERYNDPAIRAAILSASSPMSCKMTAKKFRCHQVIPSRGSEDLDLMRRVLRLKLNQHPLLIPQLMAIPAEAVIIEDASRRGGASAAFWGMKIQNGIWSGQNWLGRLWMELRVELENQMEHELTNVSGKIAKGRVHMFVSYRPQQDISSIVQWLKGTSSRILIQEFAHLRNAVLGKASLGQGIPCDQFG